MMYDLRNNKSINSKCFFWIIVIPSLYNCQHSFAKENLVFNLQNKNIDIVKAFSKICILIHHLFLAVDSNTWNENKFYCFCLLIIFTVVRMKYFISFYQICSQNYKIFKIERLNLVFCSEREGTMGWLI